MKIHFDGFSVGPEKVAFLERQLALERAYTGCLMAYVWSWLHGTLDGSLGVSQAQFLSL